MHVLGLPSFFRRLAAEAGVALLGRVLHCEMNCAVRSAPPQSKEAGNVWCGTIGLREANQA